MVVVEVEVVVATAVVEAAAEAMAEEGTAATAHAATAGEVCSAPPCSLASLPAPFLFSIQWERLWLPPHVHVFTPPRSCTSDCSRYRA